MGQYYVVANLDKRQYLNPHRFNDGAKLLEFGTNGDGTMCGLAILLADGNGRGGGDLHSDNPIIGSWAGDRIVIAGDYADPGKFVPEELMEGLYKGCLKTQKLRNLDEKTQEEYARQNCNLYTLAGDCFEDISERVIEAMKEDGYLKQVLEQNERKFGASLRPDVVITTKQ